MPRPRAVVAPPPPVGSPPRHPVPAVPPRWAPVAGALLLAAALAAGLAAHGGRPVFQGLDERWLGAVRGAPDDAATGFALALDVLGGPLGTVLPLVLTGCLAVYGRWRSGLFVFAACIAANLVVALPVKRLVDRPRPPKSWVLVNDGSFPSGQVFMVTTLVMAVGVVLLPPVLRRWWWPFGAVVVIAVMWSRLRLHTQWPSDALAGAAMGAGAVLLLWWAFARALEEEATRAWAGRLWE